MIRLPTGAKGSTSVSFTTFINFFRLATISGGMRPKIDWPSVAMPPSTMTRWPIRSGMRSVTRVAIRLPKLWPTSTMSRRSSFSRVAIVSARNHVVVEVG